MADETPNGTAGATEGAESTQTATHEDELARERKRANDAFANLRKRDATIAQLTARLDKIETEVGKPRVATTAAATGEDPEPDINEDPTGWMKWSRRQDQRQAAFDRQRQEFDNLNSFGLAAEATARQQVPDYDQAMEFLRQDYRKELEDSGELDEAAMQLLNDPAGRQNALNHAAQKGLSEADAARDLCAMGAWEWRRQRIVAAQRRMGGNPALKAVEMAKQRARANPELATKLGWKSGLTSSTQQQGNQGTTGVVDDALKELERKRNLRAAGNTTADVRDAGEPREKRAWTHDQLAELRRTNLAEFHRVTKEIARDADEDPGMLTEIARSQRH